MYKKEERINEKKYTYYYNLREGDRVRNICLDRDKRMGINLIDYWVNSIYVSESNTRRMVL